MLVIPIDMPIKAPQEIQRDVSVFLASSKKLPKKKDLPKSITAKKTTLGFFNGMYCHIGCYDKSGSIKKEVRVLTVINDSNGTVSPGMQFIFYGNEVVSSSNSWHIETLQGVNFTRHIHPDFFVYTNNEYGQMIEKR